MFPGTDFQLINNYVRIIFRKSYPCLHQQHCLQQAASRYGKGENSETAVVEDHAAATMLFFKEGKLEKLTIGGHTEWTNIRLIENCVKSWTKIGTDPVNRKVDFFVKDRAVHDCVRHATVKIPC
jgi:dTDP-D-glucose 4,6-dehydratase